MKIKKNKFKGLFVIEGVQHNDSRGYLRELYIEKLIKKKFKIQIISKSKKNVLRGLHFQSINPQGKYLSVIKGEIFDVAVDLRVNSKTFAKYFSILLSDKNCKSIYIPPGFAHGFLGLDDENIVSYNCTNYRSKNNEHSIIYNDLKLKIKWPKKKLIISKRDKDAFKFDELKHFYK
jgi:dTDP-4-dehydrorhamnose 3,5-epimerase